MYGSNALKPNYQTHPGWLMAAINNLISKATPISALGLMSVLQSLYCSSADESNYQNHLNWLLVASYNWISKATSILAYALTLIS